MGRQMKVAKRRKSANGALFAALLAAGAAFGSAEETTPVPRQSEDALGRWKRCGDVDRTCSYLESLRQRDGAYAFPGQDASHLSATYAAVMTYAALGREVPGDHAALAKAVAGPLYPIAGDRDAARTRWHWQPLHEFRLQQFRAAKALGGDVAQFRKYADSVNKPDSYATGYESGGNPVMIQQMAALLLKDECGVGIAPEVRNAFSAYLDERRRDNGSYNTTKATDGSDGHVVNTAYALAGRRVMGEKVNDERAVAWIRDCQRPDGGFSWAPNPPKGDVSDIWYAHAAVRALLDLGARPKDERAFCDWLLSLWNHDGGFAPRPGLRSDPMATFRAVDLLVRLGWLDRLRTPAAAASGGKGNRGLSGLHAFTVQFEAPGSGSVREAVQVAKELKIHLWGAKNAKPAWIVAAQAEADRCGVPVRFFRSDEAYGERRNIPGLGNFSHLRDPATPPEGACDGRPFQLWQMCDHECCARVWLDSGEYDAIGSFHFGCFDMTWILPFLYQYEETVPFVSNQDSHGETWWWRGELAAYRTVFLAKEGTWDGFREACGKGLVTSVREDAHTEGRLRMVGGSPEAKARIKELEKEWRVGDVKSHVSVQVLTPDDVFEVAHPPEGRLVRVRVDFKWRENRGLVDSSYRLAAARQNGRELAIDRREFRHEKNDYLHGILEEAYDLVRVDGSETAPVELTFLPVEGADARPMTCTLHLDDESRSNEERKAKGNEN